MAEPAFVRVGGLPYQAGSEEQAAEIAARSGGRAISEQEAQAAAKAQADLSYVDQNWGSAGKFGMGGLSGLTLGLGPGLLASGGLVDPGHLQAAQTSGLYTAGDVAGMVLPTILSGGEGLLARGASMTPAGLMGMAGSWAERAAGGVLGESAGLMGRAVGAPLRMAARGAAEGALINMGQVMGDNLIQNKPLASEALAAMGDGALYGALFGGGLGTVGALGSMAVESANNFLSKGIKSGAAGKGLLAKSVGLTDAVEAESFKGTVPLEGPSEGGFRGYIRNAQEVLQKGGADVGDTTYKKFNAAKSAQDVLNTSKNEVIDELDKQASSQVPNLQRLEGRLRDTVVTPKAGTALEVQAAKEVESYIGTLKESLYKASTDTKKLSPQELVAYHTAHPNGELPTWRNFITTRDQLAAELKGKSPVDNPLMPGRNGLKREILNAFDDEIRMSMEKASEVAPGLKGTVDKYTSTQGLLKIAQEMEVNLGEKYSKELLSTGKSLTPRDIGGAATMALWHPAAAAGWLAAKSLAPKIQARLEPGMVRAAYAQQIGVQAANAVSTVKNKISESLSKFFKNSSSAPTKYAQKSHAEGYSKKKSGYPDARKVYEDQASRTEQLLSENHQDTVRRYAEGLHNKGYGQLGNSVMDTYQRAYMYAMWNQNARQGTKSLGSLRKMPVPKVPTLQEYKSMRINKGINGPLSVLDDLEKGSISRDQVQAMKYVYPEIHTEIVSQAAQQIYEMKAEGKYLPMDKIASLGVLLDAPIDSTLTTEYVGAVQMALNTPPPETKPQGPGPAGAQGAIFTPADIQTPLQQITTPMV